MRTLAFSALFLLAACTTTAGSGATPPNLVGTTWSLTSLPGASIEAAPRHPTLIFGEGRANGSAGCNAWSSGYTQNGADVRFNAPLMTRMACVSGMDVEQRYIAAIEAARHAEVSGDALILRGESNQEVARFARSVPQGS